MSELVPNWLLNMWFGDGRDAAYGLLSPTTDTQPIERVTRQQKRYQARKGATTSSS